LNATNFFGISLTLAGGAWYAKVELSEKNRSIATASGGTSTPLLSPFKKEKADQ
jgi:hypothetical protein